MTNTILSGNLVVDNLYRYSFVGVGIDLKKANFRCGGRARQFGARSNPRTSEPCRVRSGVSGVVHRQSSASQKFGNGRLPGLKSRIYSR